MKTTVKMLVCTLLFSLMCSSFVYGADAPKRTNVDGLRVQPYENGRAGYISVGDASDEIGSSYVGLFVNGSVLLDAEIVVENGRTLVPVRVISEALGAKVDWAAENGRIILLTEDRETVMYVGRTDAMINGAGYISEPAPKIIDNKTYVPLRFVAEALNAHVAYSDGADLSQAYVLLGIRHVMISLYPNEWTPLTQEEAIEKVREQLIAAFEIQYGQYVEPPEEYSYDGTDEKEMTRERIANLKVYSENDRYFAFRIGYEFWIDKYTSDMYFCQNGNTMYITEFDPYRPDVLSLVGVQ